MEKEYEAGVNVAVTFNSLLIEIFCEKGKARTYLMQITPTFNSLLIEIFCEELALPDELFYYKLALSILF